MKVFLSYSNEDKALAGKIKQDLEDYGLTVFLAHEDIEPLAEWVDTLRAELGACVVFIPILTETFRKSKWTDQETGIAIARDILIAPLKVTVDPYGFISRFQALRVDLNNMESTCFELASVIASNPVLGDLFKDALINKFGNSWSFDDATHNTELLLSFEGYAVRQVTEIIKHAISNRQIYESFRARTRLSSFFDGYKDHLDSKLLEAFYEAIAEE